MRTAIIFLFTCTFVFAAIDDPVPNLHQPRYMVFTGGQPTADGYDQLQTMGIKTVINVLPEAECQPGEEAFAESKGMAYHKVPFDPSGLNIQTIRTFAELMSTSEKPMLIHCSTGNHVGGLWFAYRVLFDKASLPVALKEGRRIGMKADMEDAVFQWVVNQTTDKT